jgi:hypothetical protein
MPNHVKPARPGPAHADAVADRGAVLTHQEEEALVRVDHDRALALLPVVVHELSAELRRNEGHVDLRDVEGIVWDLADIPGIAGPWCLGGLRHLRRLWFAVPEEGLGPCRGEDGGSEE